MIQSVLVLGGGSAGFIAAIALRTQLPQLKVVVVRSKDLGIIGVGESTVPWVPKFLHGHLKLDPASFYRAVDPVWKLGIRFLWGPRPWFDYAFGQQLAVNYQGLPRSAGHYMGDDFQDIGPATALMTRNKAFMRKADGTPNLTAPFAYHLENPRMVAWLEEHAMRMGVQVIDGTATDAQQGEQGVTQITLADGQMLSADLYVDCSGFRSMLLGKLLQEPYVSYKSTLFCDSAIVGGWPRAQEEAIQPYTVVETMDAGWCWRLDHRSLINRGYVFSSDYISDEAAEKEFRTKNPRIVNTRILRFTNGRYERTWVKNVVALGNSGGFAEPLESTAIAAFCIGASQLTTILKETECRPTQSWMNIYNKNNAERWDGIRRFLGIHYKYNTRVDNPFWRACRGKIDLDGAEEIVRFYQENGPERHFQDYLLDRYDIFNAEGYLSLLVGMQVPCKTAFLTSSEVGRWNEVRGILGRMADQAYGYEEAMEAIKSGKWQWPAGMYGG